MFNITASHATKTYQILAERKAGAIARIGNAFTIYVVVATNGDQNEFWAAATSRHKAVREVQAALPLGWKAMPTGWRVPAEKAALLGIQANTVRKL